VSAFESKYYRKTFTWRFPSTQAWRLLRHSINGIVNNALRQLDKPFQVSIKYWLKSATYLTGVWYTWSCIVPYLNWKQKNIDVDKYIYSTVSQKQAWEFVHPPWLHCAQGCVSAAFFAMYNRHWSKFVKNTVKQTRSNFWITVYTSNIIMQPDFYRQKSYISWLSIQP